MHVSARLTDSLQGVMQQCCNLDISHVVTTVVMFTVIKTVKIGL